MRLFRKAADRARIRVTSSAGPSDTLRFDAVLIVGPIRRETDVRLRTRDSTPLELDLPAGDLLAVFRQLPGGSGTLVVEYTYETNGRKRAYARTVRRLAILLRRRGRMIAGGLDATEEAADAPASGGGS